MRRNRKKISSRIKRGISDKKQRILLVILLVIASYLFGILSNKLMLAQDYQREEISNDLQAPDKNLIAIQEKVLKDKYTFKIKWMDLGKRMVEDGVIDKVKLAQAVTGEDTLPNDLEKYFSSEQKQIDLTQDNSHFWVDVLWGLGLANKNSILEEGDMMAQGDASNFASTGGWTLGKSENPMVYYSEFTYINLSDKEQKIVEEIAGNVYRPCCGNSTVFPDCNHGMAMLGLIELMVSQNFSKDEIYKAALAFNTYWFPQTYLDIAYHFEKNGRDYEKIPASQLLSKTFSSAMGYSAISEEVGSLPWPALESGGSCGA